MVINRSLSMCIFLYRCKPQYNTISQDVCQPKCIPNPCWQNATCSVNVDENNIGSVVCDCVMPWTGQFCNVYSPEDESDPVVGIAGAAIAGIIIAIIVVLGKLTFFKHFVKVILTEGGSLAQSVERRTFDLKV